MVKDLPPKAYSAAFRITRSEIPCPYLRKGSKEKAKERENTTLVRFAPTAVPARVLEAASKNIWRIVPSRGPAIPQADSPAAATVCGLAGRRLDQAPTLGIPPTRSNACRRKGIRTPLRRAGRANQPTAAMSIESSRVLCMLL